MTGSRSCPTTTTTGGDATRGCRNPACRHLALVWRLPAVADRQDTTTGAVAVRGRCATRPSTAPSSASARPEQADPIVSAANLRLDDSDVAEIEGRA